MHFLKPIRRQIVPSRVYRHDQLHLLKPCPALQLLFERYRAPDILKDFPIYKPIKFVFAGKAFKGACLVLKNALPKVISDADIKPFRAIHHDVNVKPFFYKHKSCNT